MGAGRSLPWTSVARTPGNLRTWGTAALAPRRRTVRAGPDTLASSLPSMLLGWGGGWGGNSSLDPWGAVQFPK